jgi:hypothetical protein
LAASATDLAGDATELIITSYISLKILSYRRDILRNLFCFPLIFFTVPSCS